MPTPLGHALAGVAVYVAVNGRLKPVDRSDIELLALAVVAASLPDIDFITLGPDGWPTLSSLFHHGVTHSLGFGLAMSLVVWGWGRLRGATRPAIPALIVGGGIATHVLLDLLVLDTYPANGIGLPILWPIRDTYYMAPLLPSVDRSDLWQWSTIIGLGTEVAVGVGLIVVALVGCRRTGQMQGNETEAGSLSR